MVQTVFANSITTLRISLREDGDPKLRKSGAFSLCMWEAILFACTDTKNFDFDGSVLESVKMFFRSFGAVQTPYHLISHTRRKLVRVVTLAMGTIRQ